MKVLVIGQGGREHALAWKLAQSPNVDKVFVAPGNAGTHREPKTENCDINPMDFDGLIAFAKNQNIDLTIVGPEGPLSAGIRDAFDAAGLHCFGPNKAAAQLEASKAYAKQFLEKYDIPTARSKTFTSFEEAKPYINIQPLPLVIKADGLCAGKGVVIAKTHEEALAVAHHMLDEHQFGEASNRIVVEEFLEGEEASFIIVTDGKTIFPFATSQDHKARDEGDKGPNTGGMGAYSPAPVIDESMYQIIMSTIIEPTLKGLKEEGISYEGFLYAGLMITKEGPKVLEFNCRLGDPEAEPLLLRLENDLYDLCINTLTGHLNTIQPSWKSETAIGIVMAAHGYPGSVQKEDVIHGLNDVPPSPKYKIFHAGTKINQGKIVTNGGRVLCVTALGDDILQAQKNAYDLIQQITWEGSFYRKDIGYKAVKRAASDL